MEPLLDSTRVLSTATAVPSHCVEQQELKEFARRPFAGKFRDLERLLPIFDNGLIETRYFYQPLEWFGQEWSFPEWNALYVEHALELYERQFAAAWTGWGRSLGSGSIGRPRPWGQASPPSMSYSSASFADHIAPSS